jgi:hypothetical protein
VAAFLREQLHAKCFLDQLNLVTDRRVGQAQFGRRIADRLMPRRRLKSFECFQRWQAPQLDLALNGLALLVSSG